MKAVVMAGGEGSRLRPLTVDHPKPMVPILNKPVMEHILDLLKRNGITEIVVTVQYLASVIQNYFGNGNDFGVNIVYAVEETPMGTAGSVKNAEELLDETFIVISGDALTDFDLQAAIDYHKQKGAMATLTLYRVPNPLEYGVVIIDNEGRIRQFLEKPSWGEVFSDTINTGIYVLEPAIFKYFKKGQVFDFSQDLFPILQRNGDPLYGYIASGYWCDVGNLAEYMRANFDMLQGRVNLPIDATNVGNNLLLAGDADIAPDARIYGHVFIGKDVQIRSDTVIHGPTVIGDYSIIETGASIDRSVIWSKAHIGEHSDIHSAIIGQQCNIHNNVVVFDGAVIGDNNNIGQGAIIRANVKLWPNKQIEEGATISSSIIWGTQGRKSLFGYSGVTGLANIDMTPEFAAKLGTAYGTILAKGSTVTVNRDLSPAARMIKRALISGLPSAGIHVLDIKSVPIPVARYVTKMGGAVGGVHVRMSPYDPRQIDIKIYDSKGVNLDKNTERKIENVYFREDTRRVSSGEIGTITDDVTAADRYITDFMKLINTEAIKKAGFRVVVDYSGGTTSQVLPTILNKLGVEQVTINAASGASPQMPRTGNDSLRARQQLAHITATIRASVGIQIDTDGRSVTFVDETGAIITQDKAMAAMIMMAIRAVKANPSDLGGNGKSGDEGLRVAIPLNAPRIVDQLLKNEGVQVIRTKTSPQAQMVAASKDANLIVADGEGGFIFPQFHYSFDGLMASVKLLEWMATQGVRLSDVVASLPPFYVSETEVACPWESKGKVMRILHERERSRGNTQRQIEGLMIQDNDHEWTLILPDSDRPIFHIYSESTSPEHARTLSERYAEVVRSLQTA